MAATWEHPKFGMFRHDGLAWVSTIDMPTFKAFSYDTGYSNARRSRGKHELAFSSDDEGETPSADVIALAERLLANQKAMVTTVIDALWRDLNGQPPDTGMWWHGDLDTVADSMDADEPPASAKELLELLQLSQVRVLKKVHGYKGPIIEMSFHAAFEEEHGVGVLTDGESILGIGYSADPNLF